MTKQDILFKRHYLYEETTAEALDATTVAYLNAYLLANFGIEVDKPAKLTKSMVKLISDTMHLDVPHSFYANPQHMRFFNSTELLIEQLVSYLVVECTGNGAEDAENPEKYDRIEVFKKTLPNYVVGDEIKLRKFNILDIAEADKQLSNITKAYAEYTRPLSLDETDEFIFLIDNGYFKDEFGVACKETVFTLIDKLDISFARFLDKKDIVKYSVLKLGENKSFKDLSKEDLATLDFIKKLATYAHYCPLSKKQAKMYNKLIKVAGIDEKKVSNDKSPDKLAMAKLEAGDVLGAAKVYARNGSMLERHIKMLLSRANPREAIEILDLLPTKNPIALYQMVANMQTDGNQARTFSFKKRNLTKTHVETEYETKWRKSRLTDGTKKLLHDECLNKIDTHYAELPSLGKIYVSPDFYKVMVPTNTSASGQGLDVPPTGSRLAIRGTAIRTFVRWKGIYDVDADITAIKVDQFGNFACGKYMNFTNYHNKPFKDAILFSGDDRSADGSEYFDVQLDEIAKQGYKYLVFSFHGFRSDFSQGETICGYQDKTNLNTRAWDAKNIEFQFKVQGASHVCQAFAIDLSTNEIIVLNQMDDNQNIVLSANDFKSVSRYLNDTALELSMGRIIEHRGEVVVTPEEADIVFDNAYQPTEAQVAVRTYNIETLVSLVNDGTIELPKKDVVEE